jgi:hypothetical protein
LDDAPVLHQSKNRYSALQTLFQTKNLLEDLMMSNEDNSGYSTWIIAVISSIITSAAFTFSMPVWGPFEAEVNLNEVIQKVNKVMQKSNEIEQNQESSNSQVQEELEKIKKKLDTIENHKGETYSSPFSSQSQSLTESEAVKVIDKWLKAKQEIYGPNYNKEIAKDHATGNLLKDIENSNAGAVTWLRNNQSYWIYQDSRVDRVWGFAPDRENPHILVSIYEGRTLYRSGKPTRTEEPKAKSYRYYFQKDSSGWKIRDYCVCQDDFCDPISGCEPPYDHRN